MDPVLLSLAAATAALTSGLLIVLAGRRSLLATLLIQYSTLIFLAQGPFGYRVGFVKGFSGALAVLILWLSLRDADADRGVTAEKLVDRRSFRAVAGLIVILTGIGLNGTGLLAVPQVSPEASLAGTWLLASGLVQAGLFARPLRVGIGLLTFLSGFETFYTVLEPSLAVAAMLAGVHLGLALIVGYLVRSVHWDGDSTAVGGRQ